MTGSSGRLQNMMPCQDEVVLADGKIVHVRTTGTSGFSGLNDKGGRIDVKLKDVYYVPGLKANVISVSRMLDAGYTVTFSPRNCSICKDGIVLLNDERRGALFNVKEV